MVHVCVWPSIVYDSILRNLEDSGESVYLAESTGQWTRLPLEDVIKTVDNVGGDYSEGIKCILYIYPSLSIYHIHMS